MNASVSAATDPLVERIRAIIAAECGVPLDQMSAQSRLGHDLGIDGADAEELFEAFVREFHFDLSGIRWDDHFGPEAGWNPLFSPVDCEMLPVSITDVAASARAGRWTYTYPEAAGGSRTPNPALERTSQGGGVWSRLRHWFAP